MISRAQFQQSILPFTLKFEGGYSNHPDDNGGETYRGISRRINPSWAGWAQIDSLKNKQTLSSKTIIPELESLVESFYWQKYFISKGFDKLNDVNIALQLFDWNVNGGYTDKVVINALASVGVQANGRTLAEMLPQIAKVDTAKLTAAIIQLRKAYYDDIIKKKESQEVFRKGWYNRLKQLAKCYTPSQKVAIGGGALLLLLALGFGLFMWWKKD